MIAKSIENENSRLKAKVIDLELKVSQYQLDYMKCKEENDQLWEIIRTLRLQIEKQKDLLAKCTNEIQSKDQMPIKKTSEVLQNFENHKEEVDQLLNYTNIFSQHNLIAKNKQPPNTKPTVVEPAISNSQSKKTRNKDTAQNYVTDVFEVILNKGTQQAIEQGLNQLDNFFNNASIIQKYDDNNSFEQNKKSDNERNQIPINESYFEENSTVNNILGQLLLADVNKEVKNAMQSQSETLNLDSQLFAAKPEPTKISKKPEAIVYDDNEDDVDGYQLS